MQTIEGTQISELSLGRALAYLSAYRNGVKTTNVKSMSPEESRIFEQLKDRLNSLKLQSHLTISQRLPAGPCETNKPYLENSEDIFVEMLLLAAQNDKLNEECNQIWQHLNDCFRCFNYFCRVMRGYSLTTLELIEKENKGEK